MAATETDALLVRQVRAGDAGAWRQLIERFEGRLLGILLRIYAVGVFGLIAGNVASWVLQQRQEADSASA